MLGTLCGVANGGFRWPELNISSTTKRRRWVSIITQGTRTCLFCHDAFRTECCLRAHLAWRHALLRHARAPIGIIELHKASSKAAARLAARRAQPDAPDPARRRLLAHAHGEGRYRQNRSADQSRVQSAALKAFHRHVQSGTVFHVAPDDFAHCNNREKPLVIAFTRQSPFSCNR